jgi:hypothetical protein
MSSVSRLGVSAANFWDEATHGVAPRGDVYTTMFPMPSLSGCAFNRSLWQSIGDVAGAEGRASSNLGAANDVFWAPNVSGVVSLCVCVWEGKTCPALRSPPPTHTCPPTTHPTSSLTGKPCQGPTL